MILFIDKVVNSLSFNYQGLLQLREKFLNSDMLKSEIDYSKFCKSFNVMYTHESTAIEGNTLSLLEVKTILEDKIVPREKELREIYEVVNHEKAFNYIEDCISKKQLFSEKISKNIHAILMENILPKDMCGIYRRPDNIIKVSGSRYKFPAGNDMYYQIKDFWKSLTEKKFENPIQLAAYTHCEFVRIHPFGDGNGRTARLLMNYQLMLNNFLPIYIDKSKRYDYYYALEEYDFKHDISFLTDIIGKNLEIRYLSTMLNGPSPILEIKNI